MTLSSKPFTMDNTTRFRALLKFCYYFVKVFGFLPIYFNCNKNRFETCWPQIVYSLLVLVSFAYIYLTSGVAVISALSPLIAVAFTNLSVTTICVTCLLQCKNHSRIVKFLNQSKAFFHRLNLALITDGKEKQYRRHLWRLFIKVVAVNFIAQFALINAMHNLLVLLTGSRDTVAIFIVSAAYFMQSMVPNIFYAALQVADFYLHRINNETRSIVRRAKYIENSSNLGKFAKSWQYCGCSDRLDELAEHHQKLTNLMVELNQLFSLQLLFNTLNFFGIFVIEVFLYCNLTKS